MGPTAIRLPSVAFIFAACGAPRSTADSSTSTTEPLVLSGTITLERPVPNRIPCTGDEEHEEFHGGANIIVVRDGEGSVIGAGELEDGVPVGQGDGRCFCAFAYEAVLTGPVDFYTVEVAGRSGWVYSHAQMEESGWTVNGTFE